MYIFIEKLNWGVNNISEREKEENSFLTVKLQFVFFVRNDLTATYTTLYC